MQMKIFFLVLFAVMACAFASEYDNGRGRRRNGNGNGNGGPGVYNGRGGYQGRERQGFNGQGEQRYRSNLYSDDDVYGYDATYPNGEAAYINYRSKDARQRRGPEFARTSRAYSRQGGAREGGYGQGGFGPGGFGQGGFGNGQRNEYGGGAW